MLCAFNNWKINLHEFNLKQAVCLDQCCSCLLKQTEKRMDKRCVFWPANGCFACCLLVKIIFFSIVISFLAYIFPRSWPAVVYFNQLLSAARTQKLFETFFSAVVHFKSFSKWNLKSSIFTWKSYKSTKKKHRNQSKNAGKR